jgi:RNA polymerase sigma factor (sigma-70 family)
VGTPSLEELSDADLVLRCRDGSQPAWNALVRRFQRLVYTVPRRAGLSEAQAADVFQVAFSRLFEHIDRLDDASRVRAWLVTTAKRETLRLLEQNQRLAEPLHEVGADADGQADDDAPGSLADRLADPNPLPEALLDDLQQQDRLHRALALLDERSRALLTLLFLQDETPSYDDIAQRLQMAAGSVGPTRARCLQRLRTIMETL